MKVKESIRGIFLPFVILLSSFVGVTIFSMVYMAKDNNYDNMIYQYFNISKAFYGKLIYLDISKETLVNGMNWCSLLFLLGNFLLFRSLRSDRRKHKGRGAALLLCLYLLFQALAYHTGFQKLLYFGYLGFLPEPRAFRSCYTVLHYLTVTGNLFVLAASLWGMLFVNLRKELVPELFRVKLVIFLTQSALAGLYFYLYFSLPDAFLWMSRSTGYISYRSLTMAPYVKGMRAVTALIIVFLLVLLYYLYQYWKKRRKVQEEEYVFSSIIASSEISTRAFSHYVKNELLGIQAEAEPLAARLPENIPELENIQRSCREMYERLNELQKNSNRIVLNRSRRNLAEVITEAVEENRAILEKSGCRIVWEDGQKKAEVFLDAYYMREVFRNIFRNAMEAMEHGEGERKVYVRLQTYGEEAEIMISDTGPGLPESVQSRLFNPFVSTKSTKQNWGIGLSFCKRIVTSHRGRIYAENSGEAGAVFHIFLPITGDEQNGT